MANPFLDYFSSQSTSISVNNIKANAFGNIILNIDSIPNLESRLNGTGTSNVSILDDLTDVVISNPLNNQGLIYNSTDSKFENQTIDHVNLSNKGTNTHA